MEQIFNQGRSEDAGQRQGRVILLGVHIFRIPEAGDPRLMKKL